MNRTRRVFFIVRQKGFGYIRLVVRDQRVAGFLRCRRKLFKFSLVDRTYLRRSQFRFHLSFPSDGSFLFDFFLYCVKIKCLFLSFQIYLALPGLTKFIRRLAEIGDDLSDLSRILRQAARAKEYQGDQRYQDQFLGSKAFEN
ncbi:hypothetical protein JVX88_05380 [Leptolyngbya sp. 7M]|nr:hypothetical protein [Leptolyngbya sp. 7M]QYO68925.1 hypothetical protein JVX88_05380 [Leptolyngbya sp. 7M]